MRLRPLAVTALACGATLVPASGAHAAAKRPTCQQVRTADYAMFSKAGNRAVGRVLVKVVPVCNQGRKLKYAVMIARVRVGLKNVGKVHDELGDTTPREEIADMLERTGAGFVDALEELY